MLGATAFGSVPSLTLPTTPTRHDAPRRSVRLHAVFDRDRPYDAVFEDTWNVDNGSKPHQINFYLTKKSCGAAVADALT